MWKPIKYEYDDGYFSVQVSNPDDGREYWVDVAVKDQDIEADWNQFIFCANDEEDMARKRVQEDPEAFSDAVATAVCYLEKEGAIAQDGYANWSVAAEAGAGCA